MLSNNVAKKSEINRMNQIFYKILLGRGSGGCLDLHTSCIVNGTTLVFPDKKNYFGILWQKNRSRSFLTKSRDSPTSQKSGMEPGTPTSVCQHFTHCATGAPGKEGKSRKTWQYFEPISTST